MPSSAPPSPPRRQVLLDRGRGAFRHGCANHLSIGPSTFPFAIFSGRWQDETLMAGTPVEVATVADQHAGPPPPQVSAPGVGDSPT